MTWVEFAIGLGFIALAVVLGLVVRDERTRAVLQGLTLLGGLGWIWARLTGREKPAEMPTIEPTVYDYDETDEEITSIDDALADADVDAHDGAGAGVADALELLEDHDAHGR